MLRKFNTKVPDDDHQHASCPFNELSLEQPADSLNNSTSNEGLYDRNVCFSPLNYGKLINFNLQVVMSKRTVDRKARKNLCLSFEDDGVGVMVTETVCNYHAPSGMVGSVFDGASSPDSGSESKGLVKFDINCQGYDDDCEDENGEMEGQKELNMAEELLKFMIMFNISKRAMDYLLKLLILFRLDVPKSVFLLKRNLKKTEIAPIPLDNRHYAFFRITDALSFCVKNRLLNLSNSINDLTVYINIDGLPLFRSSNTGLWTILMKIKNSLFLKPLPLAVYCGVGKPDLSSFISKMTEELAKLSTSQFNVEHISFQLKRIFFICDAPARAFIQCVKGHSAKDGCSYCNIQGIFSDKRLYFPYCSRSELNELSRSRHLYATNQESNQTSLSPLAQIVDLRNDFLPDYMHCVCLGIMKKMCTFFFSTVKGVRLPCKLPESQKLVIEQRISTVRPHIPKEFNRKLRSLSELEHYKAVEFRSILLYFGPFLFKDVVHVDYYHNFLLLHFSIYALCSPKYCIEYLENSTSCLEMFCSQLSTLYDNKFSSYNSHIVRHIPEFVNEHGVLDDWSAFCFENYLSILKRRLRCTRDIFKQTVNSLSVMANLFIEHTGEDLFINEHEPNNCVLLNNGRVCIVDAVDGQTVIKGTIMRFLEPLYTYPYCSYTSFKIGFFTPSNKIVNNEQLFCKCIILKTDMPTRYLIVPMVSGVRKYD